MYDKIEKTGNSIIQHGTYNNRIYLMKLDKKDYPAILNKLYMLAEQKKYTKIFAKIPEWAYTGFQSEGYIKEASIPKFYNGKINVLFCSKFINKSRSFLDKHSKDKTDKFIKLALSKRGKPAKIKHHLPFRLSIIEENEISQLAQLYAKVFKSYPFPIFEEAYLKKTMCENVIYFGIFFKNKLIAASSAEMDLKAENAEMTDFATDPEFAGNNLSVILLQEMEAEMDKRNMKTLYTIARSFSAGMNITFAKLNYDYSGTLVNNTNIFGKIESMNVWYKLLI